MRWLDLFLLDRVFQPICDALYDRVGDCVQIARYCLTATMSLLGWYVGWRMADIMRTGAERGLVLMFLASQGYLLFAVMYCSHRLRWLLGYRGANPLRHLLFFPRFMLLLGTTVLWMNWLWMDWQVGSMVEWVADLIGVCRDMSLVSALYFASCQNYPPLKRARYWAPA